MRCDVRAAIAQIVIQEASGYYRYEGEVNQDGYRHGKGVLSWLYMGRYVGEFRNNQRHGHGTKTNPDGTVLSGKWENHNFRG